MKDPTDLALIPRTEVYAEESLEAEIILKLRSGVALGAAIPWDMPTEDVLRWIMACGTLLARADRMSAVVKPALGRLMAMARKAPEFLPTAECKDLREFEDKLTDKTGYSRTSLHHCQLAYEWAGDILTSDYEACGWTNLLLLARHSKGASDKQKKELIDGAKGKTVEELRTWLDEAGHAPKGQTTGATMVLTGSQDDIQELRTWLARPDIQAAAGSADPLAILLAATAEVSTEWLQKKRNEHD